MTVYKLFIGNLGWSVDEDLLHATFKDCGDLIGASIIRDSESHSKGFGFVELGSEEALEKGLKLHDQVLKGRPMRVERVKRHTS